MQFFAVAALLAAALVLPAQQSAKPTPAPPSAAQSASPEPSELQKAKLENLSLKFTLLKQQETQLQQDYDALIRQIELEHPGFTWNPQASRLMSKPPATPAQK